MTLKGAAVSRIDRRIKSWDQFVIRGLSVRPELLGCSHVFPFSGARIEIALPGLDRVAKRDDAFALVTPGSRKASDDSILEFDIHRVNVTADLGSTASIAPESLERPPVLYDLYEERERTRMAKFCQEHRQCSEAAFQYWLSILRWKLDDFRIGRSVLLKHESGWGTHLHDQESNHPVWISTGVFMVEGRRVVDVDEWGAIESHLQTEHPAPTYALIRYDAQESLYHRDYRKSLIELAMACELFLRQMMLKRLPEKLLPTLVEAIEELNISQYVSRHFRGVLSETGAREFGKLSKELNSLFSKRNKLLHMGESEPATRENCERFLKVARRLHNLESEIAHS
jgi:hypothetical protein